MKLKTKDFGFVAFQCCLFILYFFDSPILFFEVGYISTSIALFMIVIGGLTLVIAMLQLNSSLSPFPSPKSDTTLVQNGLYEYIRHPIYTAILLITFGYGIYAGSFFKIIVSFLLYILFYFKSIYEEERLMLLFTEYVWYTHVTGRFFPRIRIK